MSNGPAVRPCPCARLDAPKVCGRQRRGYLCSRLPGHRGRHIACGFYGHRLKVWSTPRKGGGR